MAVLHAVQVVDEAGRRRDDALVVARCEFNPSPACPQTHITGTGPETRTANNFLGDTQRELDNAVTERDRRAPALDSEITDREKALAQARAATSALGANVYGFLDLFGAAVDEQLGTRDEAALIRCQEGSSWPFVGSTCVEIAVVSFGRISVVANTSSFFRGPVGRVGSG